MDTGCGKGNRNMVRPVVSGGAHRGDRKNGYGIEHTRQGWI